MQSRASIPQPEHFQYKHGVIPQNVAEIDEKSEESLKLSFFYYNDKACEIKYFGKKAKNALEKIKIIGRSTRSSLDANGIQLSPVHNSGSYKKLFTHKLPSDFYDSMKEHKFSGTCRIFCTLDGNTCNIIAITFNHLETGKQRR